jgi:hypothetical protein
LFGSSGPSLDQQILNQVKALRDEVRALGNEMRSSFARVEAQINVVYANMTAQFDKLNAAIAGNTAQLSLVQRQIAQLGLRLEDIAAAVLTAIGDATMHDARTDINKYIGYRENFGQPIPTFNEFLDPENEFHLAATDLANDVAFVVPKTDADNPAVDPTTVLNSFGESRSINYLARLASKRDPGVPDPITPVGNPGVWNLGAQAYSMLMLQNARTADYTWSDEQVIRVHCTMFRCDSETTPDQGLAQKWPTSSVSFALGASITTNTAVDSSLTTNCGSSCRAGSS